MQGTTETPEFQIDAGGLPVPLKTRFTAIVDGSDGDTYLNQVDANFLNTQLTAKGAVIGFEGMPGRQIEVDVDMQNGRIEDLLRLAVQLRKADSSRARPGCRPSSSIPPEKKKVIDKLQLRGRVRPDASDVHRSVGAEQARSASAAAARGWTRTKRSATCCRT